MTIEGKVTSIRFRNEQDGWSIFFVTTEGNSITRETECVKGTARSLRKGMMVRVTGERVNDRYGSSIKAASVEEVLPSDVEGIYKYLSSGLIKNIGPIFADKIVKAFGADTLRILDEQPERLREIKGIGSKRIESVIESVKEQRAVRSVMIWLKRYDLPNGLAARIYKAYGNESIARLEENPYRLADDIKGVAFKRADEVARLLGLEERHPFRILSALRAFLEDRAAEGNACMPVDETVRRTASEEYLNIDELPVRAMLESGQFLQVGTIEDGMAYLPKYLHAEEVVAERLCTIMSRGRRIYDPAPDFGAIEGKTGKRFSEEQKEAVVLTQSSPVTVLTGGPGTGKTTTTNAIIENVLSLRMKVVLAAPTGRAAKRMTESTGRPAKTIHRLLEYGQDGFQRNADNPIEADALIVDEASMIDTLLMMHLLKAVPDRTKLVIVGDTDQLPSVGAGRVLLDIIDSGVVPTAHLTHIYRQAQGSDIIMNAHRVDKGQMPYFRTDAPTDFHLVELEDKDAVATTIIDLVRAQIPQKAGFMPEDIQVLTPMRRDWDPIGAVQLNAALQQVLNPDGEKVAAKPGAEFRTGDRVMQTRNNYELEIFNGDMGRVLRRAGREEDDNAVLEAEFDGRTVRLNQEDLGDLELAYACTVHKSQGSEFPVAVIPIHSSQFVMLKRNLLYTAITRAKRLCILVGNRKGIWAAVSRVDTERRNTRLTERLFSRGQQSEVLFF